jgi:hypothetical protein
MSLLAAFLAIVQDWRSVFPQQRTFGRGATSARVADLSGAPLPDLYHLDQRRPEPQLERGVFPPLALPVGAAAVVSADLETCFGLYQALVQAAAA